MDSSMQVGYMHWEDGVCGVERHAELEIGPKCKWQQQLRQQDVGPPAHMQVHATNYAEKQDYKCMTVEIQVQDE